MGLFFLHGVSEHPSLADPVKYPTYYGLANNQFLFYMHEFGEWVNGERVKGEWDYWHQVGSSIKC